jgi:AAA family ATP:ADP antiporter
MPRQTDYSSVAAVISSGAMIAFQIGGKAARDALFLSNFPVTALPAALVAAAVLSVLSVLAASWAMSARGPGAVIPYAFGFSSILLLGEWSIFGAYPRVAAVLFYFHMASVGAVLISGFWSMVSEFFDPRTAKIQVGRIAAAGTAGGIVGGVVAERTGAMLSATAMLPVLAVLHLLCAGLNLQLRKPKIARVGRPSGSESLSVVSGFKVLSNAPYLKNLACLVLLGTVAEALLDYVLKTQATGIYGRGDQLIRFFGVFYTGVSLLTFVVQSVLSRYSLQYLGLAGTISTLPLMVVVSGAVSLIVPGLYSIGIVRGGESVLRSSLFRSGYELLYAPVPTEEKRAAKPIVDVGFDRLGDAVGGGLIRGILSLDLGVFINNRVLIATSVLLGGVSLVLTRRIRAGYVSTLERSLLDQASGMDLLDVDEKITRGTILRTLGSVDAIQLRQLQQAQRAIDVPPAPSRTEPQTDPLIQQLIDLRSEDPAVVRLALSAGEPLDLLLIAPAIRVLARDDLSEDAVRALRKVVPMAVGQLTDALVNADEDFAVRRRIPRVLASYASARTVDGLLEGLRDSRFEVRFNCGRALSRVCSTDENIRPEPKVVYAAAIDEIRLAERLSEAPKMLDHYEDGPDPSGESLWNSTDTRLEHVFRLLSLCLPREPLHVAFQALHTDNAYLRGTALEYLDSVLPAGVREHIWKFLEGPAVRTAPTRPTDVVVQDLMMSRPLIDPEVASARRRSTPQKA